ncbi:MAG TPA: precorrin-6A reductase [Anaerovoracaceae bacterium]|nr:precorrin-6A reductase [Anaerovoracaceae bacterium]
MPNLLVFAGTTEGRVLLETVSRVIDGSGLTVYACVATDYGKEMLPECLEHIRICSGRLTEDGMTALMMEKQFDLVIDTTHPYAGLVSENIRAASRRAGCSYIRVLRSSGIDRDMDCLFFGNHEAAAEYLDRAEGNVLLTVGSKELSKYTTIKDYQKRIFPRVLPMPGVVESCYSLGFSGKQLICMQGPFTAGLNAAMIRQIDASYIVTKDSGEAGGFFEKYQAAQETGAVLLVIGREKEEEGIPMESLLELLENTYHLKLLYRTGHTGIPERAGRLPAAHEPDPGHWFPFFTNISEKTFVVIGAGKIARRRIEALLKFDCRIRVIALEALPEVTAYAEEKKLDLRIKSYEPSDLEGADYVLAASNDKQLNHNIYKKCREANIPVNTADDREKSDFYFPGVVRKNGVTVGVTAEGRDHGLAKRATKAIAGCLNRDLPEGRENRNRGE